MFKGGILTENKKLWFKLDNAAKIYPPTQSRHRTEMFRMSATLTEDIDDDVLGRALRNTLKRFPVFSCSLHRGFFWYYLEQNDGIPPIKDDVRNPMVSLNPKENNGFMFRVRKNGKMISLEYFHVLTDGTGGMVFLQTLVSEYIRIKYGVKIPESKYIKSCDEEPKQEEFEDGFLRYASKNTISRGEKSAYHPTATPLEWHEINLISGRIKSEILLQKAKEYGVTVGVLLTAVLIQSLLKRQKSESVSRRRNMPVKVSVPVNLRNYFPTESLRNFSFFLNPGVDPRLGEYTFEEILVQVKAIMLQGLTAKQLRGRFSENVSSERNPLVRALPLFIKNPVMRLVYAAVGDRYFSANISNLGVMDVPPEYARYVTDMSFFLGHPSGLLSVSTVMTYNGITRVNFTRTTKEPDVEREFYKALVKMGVPVLIESNERR